VKTKAFSYLRVSGIGQIEGDGFDRQRDAIARYARKTRLEVVNEFRDEGVSGATDAFDREGLTELFVALKANGVRTVVIERPDRLARQLMVGEIILSEFRKIGVKVISAESGTDLTTEDDNPEKTLIRHMLGAIAQWEKAVIVQKLRAARTRIRRETGRCEGRKAFGVSPEEQAVIEKMKAWRTERKSFAEIAAALNAENVSTRSGEGTKWHPTQVQRILKRK
jgi:DNA invertase Pin-like site-specific DNA recombinase